jgi:hypothetical protein
MKEWRGEGLRYEGLPGRPAGICKPPETARPSAPNFFGRHIGVERVHPLRLPSNETGCLRVVAHRRSDSHATRSRNRGL